MKDVGGGVKQCGGYSSPLLLGLWKDISGKWTNSDKVQLIRRFYVWIITHIRYDIELYRARTAASVSLQKQDGQCEAVDAVLSKRALCTGFTDLLYHFCSYSEIICMKVDGHVKGYGYEAGDSFVPDIPNHQWLAVYVGCQWKLLDPVWDCGYVDKVSGEFVPRITTYYLFREPHRSVRDHYPLDSRWQLLNRCLDLSEFTNQPVYGTAFELYSFKTNITDLTTDIYTGSICSFCISCDRSKLLLSDRCLRVIVWENDSRIVLPKVSSLTFEDKSNTAYISVSVDFPSVYLIEVYLIEGKSEGKHLISTKLTAKLAVPKYPFVYNLHSSLSQKCALSFSKLAPDGRSSVLLPYNSDVSFRLKIRIYHIINGRQIIARGCHLSNNAQDRKLVLSVPESGAYKIIVYAASSKIAKRYQKIYTSVSLIKIQAT